MASNGKTYLYSNESDEILKLRANEIAGIASLETSHLRSFVIFEVGGMRFAIDASEIAQILSSKTIIPLPFTPAFIVGIVNYRGDFRTVLDLSLMISGPPSTISTATHILVLQESDEQVSIVSESIPYTMMVDENEIQKEYDFTPEWIRDIIDGIVIIQDSFVGILSTKRIANHKRLEELLDTKESGVRL